MSASRSVRIVLKTKQSRSLKSQVNPKMSASKGLQVEEKKSFAAFNVEEVREDLTSSKELHAELRKNLSPRPECAMLDKFQCLRSSWGSDKILSGDKSKERHLNDKEKASSTLHTSSDSLVQFRSIRYKGADVNSMSTSSSINAIEQKKAPLSIRTKRKAITEKWASPPREERTPHYSQLESKKFQLGASDEAISSYNSVVPSHKRHKSSFSSCSTLSLADHFKHVSCDTKPLSEDCNNDAVQS
mmetsp:Transcript_7958/g.12020  ORF Transcript_7958/g.12020 Transcript_7958/m.12020 type:complete len:244 (+) Transcript_7958:67-798(+)